MDRDALIVQMAKAFSGRQVMDPSPPTEELRRRAAEALTRVEIYLGADVEQAKEVFDARARGRDLKRHSAGGRSAGLWTVMRTKSSLISTVGEVASLSISFSVVPSRSSCLIQRLLRPSRRIL